MAKIDVNQAAEIIKKHEVPPDALRAIVEEMNLAVQKEDTGEEPTPHVKKQFFVLVSDPLGRLPDACDFVAWVGQLPESESPSTVAERINRAAYEYNTTKKGRLLPVKTHGEAIENIPGKFFKECDVWVKTKTPVLVLRTDNQIPREVSAA
jgi:hypothetical protein